LIDACPLCAAVEGEAVAQIPYAMIWEELERQWHVSFPAELRARHSPGDVTELRRCAQCGVAWFVGAVPGDAEFYRQLMSQVPYVAGRWEFTLVHRSLTPSDRVVDFGAGDGEFLRSLAGVVSRRAGVDHNQDALRRMAADGIEAGAGDFATFAAQHEGEFTVATAFQVVEHLGHVDDVLVPALRCLGASGRLFVSVPDRDRMPEAPLEPLDCPPHHISRWGTEQLQALADRFGLKVVALHRQPPAFGRVAARAMAPLDARLGATPLPPARRLARGVVRRAMIGERRHALLARTGAYPRLGLYGHTMLAEMVGG
jgi:SAM-dependent methyltransferase